MGRLSVAKNKKKKIPRVYTYSVMAVLVTDFTVGACGGGFGHGRVAPGGEEKKTQKSERRAARWPADALSLSHAGQGLARDPGPARERHLGPRGKGAAERPLLGPRGHGSQGVRRGKRLGAETGRKQSC